jgi:antitoxin YefM
LKRKAFKLLFFTVCKAALTKRTDNRTIRMTTGGRQMETMPIIEARNKLTSLPEVLEGQLEQNAIAVTRRGKPVLAVMSWDFYESLLETLEIMSDAELLPLLRKSLNEAAKGRTVPWNTAKKQLGL